MEKAGLYAVPVLTILVVGAVFFGLGTPRSVRSARIYGGPTDAVTRLSWRVEKVERRGTPASGEPAAPLQVRATSRDGRTRSWIGPVDDAGAASVLLDFGSPPLAGAVKVWVTAGPQTLAQGEISLTAESWLERSRTRGGPVKGRTLGSLTVEVGPSQGVIAVPFVLPLSVRVTESGRPVPLARLTFAPEGMLIQDSRRLEPWSTDDRGQSEVLVEPREHVVALGVVADGGPGRQGQFYSTLPVVAGALLAELVGKRLRISAGVPLDQAYYALETERSRWSGGGVVLKSDGRGGSVGEVDLDALPPSPWWAVVSADSDLDSPATVGWPLGIARAELWPRARSVPDRLLLDGLGAALAAEARRRQDVLTFAVAAVAAAALLSSLLLVKRVRDAEQKLARHLALQAPDEPLSSLSSGSRSALATVIALVCLGLGFLLMALWLFARLGEL